MNLVWKLSLIAALTAYSSAFAQSNNTMEPVNGCIAMKEMKDMKGVDLKDVNAKKCADMMKGMNNQPAKASGATDVAEGVVTQMNPAQGMVTLAHGPVKSLGWPAMTMGFTVKDKKLFDKLAVGKKVRVELSKEGPDYVITGVER